MPGIGLRTARVGLLGLWLLTATLAQEPIARAAEQPMPLGWWMLDTGQGPAAVDRSRSGHDGQIVGAEWAPTRSGGAALEFDGINDYVTVRHDAALNLRDALTITAWLFPVDLAGDGGLLVKGSPYLASGYLFLREGDRLAFRVATEHTPGEGVSGEGYAALKSGPVLAAGRWQHVAVVYSAATGRAALFYNGRRIKQVPADGRIVYLTPKLPLNLGAMSHPRSGNLRGFLRDVRLYATALDEQQIRKQYVQAWPAIAKLDVKAKEERRRRACTSQLQATLVDRRTGKPLAAKVFVRSAAGDCYWPSDALVYGLAGPRQCFYATGAFTVPVPAGKFEISATRGFEYVPQIATLEVAEGEQRQVRLELDRSVDMPAKGWYAGEHHLHPVGHGGRRYDQRMTLATAAGICQAEGLDYAFWMGPRGHDIARTDVLADPWIVDGKLGQVFAANGFVAQCCVEPIGVCGHRCVVGTPRWSIQGNPQFEALAVFDQVQRQGGLAIFSHPYAGGVSLAKDSGLCFARELPLAVALGRARMWDLLCWGGSLDDKLRDWYRWLNLGFRLAIGGSTDCYMNNPAEIIAPGHNRTYAKAAGLTIPDLVDAYRRGRTVATNGPLLVFTVAGHDVGDVLTLDGRKPQRLQLHVEAHAVQGLEHVEIVANGRPVKSLVVDGQQHAEATFAYEVGRSCWLAARSMGRQGAGGGPFAHTSPVYVQYGQTALEVQPADVEYFLGWLAEYRRAVEEYGRRNGHAPQEYAGLLARIEQAAGVYRRLAATPRLWMEHP
jgi:hypothetical protein